MRKRLIDIGRLMMFAGFVASSSAQLLSNGGFEDDSLGTSSVALTNGVIDATTFSGWRMYTVGDPIAPFTATVVNTASDGSQAMQLDMPDLTIGADHGFDRGGNTIPVVNTNYTLFFDAALISGSPAIEVIFAEYGVDGEFLGQQRIIPITIPSASYQPLSVEWTPLTGDAISLINISFKQVTAGAETSSSILLDNVRFTRDDLPAEGLYTPMASFNKTDHVVSTTVFQWYTSTGGQLDGPWLPLEGRPLWTGFPDWWVKQIKQMMMANIDVLNVQLVPAFDQERINLFKALNQLRYEGYDVPKVSPFLDSKITWNGTSIDVATAAGKNEFADQYIRFFNQYYGVNQDADAGDYLAKYDDQPLLSVYRVETVLTNAPSLTRNDVTSRLLAEFGSTSPFTNDIYMASAEFDSPTLSFSDEKNSSFGDLGYFRKSSWAGVDAAMVKPGYWTQNYQTPGFFYPRDGGSHYTAAWNSVNSDSTLNRVYVETWNEYDQGSGIYAGDAGAPYISTNNVGGNTDTWSSSNDPYEYIRTTAAGAATFNDILDNDAQVIWNDFPDTMYFGETQVVTVVVRNAGDLSWTAAAGYQFGDMAGGASLFGGDRYLLDDTADEIPIYGGIFRGRPKVFQITLIAPSSPGAYETHWSMVQDGGVEWFGEEFVHTITVSDIFDIPVQIAPESTVEGYNVVSWLSEPEREYAVRWSSDLILEPFVVLESGIQWPQASYTDQTVRAGTKGFYQVDVSIGEPPVLEGLQNGDFEIEGTNGVLSAADWLVTDAGVVGRYEELGQPGHGDYMMLLQDNQDAWHWAYQRLPAIPGVSYTATSQFKAFFTPGEEEIAYIVLEWFDASGSSFGNIFETYLQSDIDYLDFGWVTRSITGVAPSGATHVEVRVMSKFNGNGNGALWADNVTFTEN